MSTTARKTKLDHLEALIAHPRTPENERRAAEAMRARLLAKMAEGDAVGLERSPYARSYGEKYNRVPEYAPVAVIARAIREDIKLARKIAQREGGSADVKPVDPIGDAPAEIKFSVRSSTFSGGCSVDIAIVNADPSWAWTIGEDRYGDECEMPTPALRALADELAAVMWAYNHDGSDTMTDHFDVRFYGNVSLDGRILA